MYDGAYLSLYVSHSSMKGKSFLYDRYKEQSLVAFRDDVVTYSFLIWNLTMRFMQEELMMEYAQILCREAVISPPWQPDSASIVYQCIIHKQILHHRMSPRPIHK